LAKQPEAILIGERHAPEVTAEDARNAVMLRQPLVEKRVIGPQQILDRPILANLALEEELRLPSHGVTQCGIELELLGGLLRAQVPYLEPLLGKVFQEAARPIVGEHPPNLLCQDLRIGQLLALGN